MCNLLAVTPGLIPGTFSKDHSHLLIWYSACCSTTPTTPGQDPAERTAAARAAQQAAGGATQPAAGPGAGATGQEQVLNVNNERFMVPEVRGCRGLFSNQDQCTSTRQCPVLVPGLLLCAGAQPLGKLGPGNYCHHPPTGPVPSQ